MLSSSDLQELMADNNSFFYTVLLNLIYVYIYKYKKSFF